MTLGVFIQLNPVGSSVGPLVNLFSDADGYTTPFEINVPISTLIQGYWFNTVPANTTTIQVKSYGDCVNSVYLTISNLPGCDTMYCAEMCCNFELVNNSGSLKSWMYYDCEGTPVSGIYDDNDSIRFCADQSLGPILVDTGCSLIRIGCCFECSCYTLIGYNPFTVEYVDCEGDTQTSIATFFNPQYIVSYCGASPTVISGSFDETYISGNCFWDGIGYNCPV